MDCGTLPMYYVLPGIIKVILSMSTRWAVGGTQLSSCVKRLGTAAGLLAVGPKLTGVAWVGCQSCWDVESLA